MRNSRKIMFVSIWLIIATFFAGCTNEEATEKEAVNKEAAGKEVTDNTDGDKEFVIDYYQLSITAPREWTEREQDNFDLQLTNDEAYVSIMAYYTVDLREGWDSEVVYEWQNDDLFSKRENVEIVEPLEVIESDGKTITVTLYSAENEGHKNYYYSCLVEFDDNDEVFAWVLVNGMPSYIEKNKENLMDIVETMEYEEE